MKLNYRNQKNAEATAKFWNKPLDRPDWFKVQASAEDETEILIYDIIGWPFVEAAELIRVLAGITTGKILVRINSPGGDVFDSVAIYNALKEHKAKVTTRIEALAASAASFIAIAGKEVQAYSNAMMMIHEPYVLTAGNQYDLREVADILEKISGSMIDIYAANAAPGKREIAQMMKDETWLSAKEAKEKGFIDTILESGKGAKAQFDLSMFAHCPDCLQSQNMQQEPNERDIERLLRESGGLSKNQAQGLLARGWKAVMRSEQELEQRAAEMLIKIISGGK
ncbi:MAG: head maturation protease, ClpP-related [Candidatus Omnitrophota bacterium]